MKKTIKYAFVGALFAAAVPFAAAAEKSAADVKKCSAVYESASKAIAKDPAKVLELVSKLVAANESCAADVVKAAIKTTKANKELVGQIVETAATVAPKQLSQIAAAAMAVAVDSRIQIAAVVNKINAQQGTSQTQTQAELVSMFSELGDYSFELTGNVLVVTNAADNTTQAITVIPPSATRP